MNKIENQRGRKPSRRSLRYGKLVRGWDWRTTPELLEKAETKRKEINLSRTEFLELALTKLIENEAEIRQGSHQSKL